MAREADRAEHMRRAKLPAGAGPARRWRGMDMMAGLRRAAGAALLVATLLAPLAGHGGAAAGDTALAQADSPVPALGEAPRFGAPPAAAPASAAAPAACDPAADCAAQTETDSAMTRGAAALQVADPASPGAGAPSAGDALEACPVASPLARGLRARWDAGSLAISARQGALAALVPDSAALAALGDRLRGGAVEPTDALGWLLTRREAPRYPDNPYVTLTRDLAPGDTASVSYESRLAASLATGDGPFQPQDALALALGVAGGDYPLASLVAHNLLKEIAYASRDGTGALVGWSASDRGSADDAQALSNAQYVVVSADDVQALAAKLAALRPADDPRADDKLGPWVHLFGTLFLGALVGGPTPFGPEADLLAGWYRPDAAADPFEDQVAACGVRLVGVVAALASPATAAPVAAAPAPGVGASVPGAAPPPTASLADPAGGPASPFAPDASGGLASPFAAPGAAVVAGAANAVPGAANAGTGAAGAPAAAPVPGAPAAPTPLPISPFAAPVTDAAIAAQPAYYPTPVLYPTAIPYQAPVAAVQAQAPLPAAIPTVIPTVTAPGVSGVVRNAQNGQGVTGATVTVAGRTATTDATGSYQLTGLTPGSVQVSVSATGFIADNATVTVPTTGMATQNFGLSQSLAAGQFRVVLTWSDHPRDLDAVLYVPSGGARAVLDYHNRSVGGATLDADDRNGQGPETITINQASPGQYSYIVHQYTYDGLLSTSGARVRILRGDSEVQSFTAPAGGDLSLRWWTVFTFDGTTGTVTPVNTLSAQAPAR